MSTTVQRMLFQLQLLLALMSIAGIDSRLCFLVCTWQTLKIFYAIAPITSMLMICCLSALQATGSTGSHWKSE